MQHTSNYVSERKLWKSVLLQAVRDACSDTEKWYVVQSARMWLTEHSEDLATVCVYAGVDVDHILRIMRGWKEKEWDHPIRNEHR